MPSSFALQDQWTGCARPVRIIADDLTGAADSSAPLAQPDAPALVLLRPEVSEGRAVTAWDVDSRERPIAERQSRLAAVASILRKETGSPLIIQKVDSLGRGHIVDDVGSLLIALDAAPLAVVCPAFPAQGRIFQDGSVIDAADGTRRIDLDAAFRAAGLPTARVPVDRVGSQIEAVRRAGCQILLVNAETDADMQALARQVCACASPPLVVGSAGFTGALAALAPRPAVSRATAPASRVSLVLGTAADKTRRQAHHLCSRRPVDLITRSEAEWKAARGTAMAGDAAYMLERNEADDLDGDAVRAMVGALQDAIADAGTLVFSGGDTVRAALDALGLDRFDVLGSIEPGLTHCFSAALSGDFFTKSGGFGDLGTLLRLYDRLRPTKAAL